MSKLSDKMAGICADLQLSVMFQQEHRAGGRRQEQLEKRQSADKMSVGRLMGTGS